MDASLKSEMSPQSRAMAIVERSRCFDDSQPQHKWPVDWATRPNASVDLGKLAAALEQHLTDAIAQEREACAGAAEQYLENGDGTKVDEEQRWTAETIALDIRGRTEGYIEEHRAAMLGSR